MGQLDGRVALITGAARGQGRSHAVTFAREGAKLILSDICAQVPSVRYPMSSEADLDETAELVRATGAEVVTRIADVRDGAAIDEVVTLGLEAFGRIDIVCANAGIADLGKLWEFSRAQFDEMIAINLTGVWETCRAVVPQLIKQGDGGSLIATSSCAGLRGFRNAGHYAAAKHGVVGLMRSFAIELGEYQIRSNAVCPFTVGTPMVMNDASYSDMTGGADPTEAGARRALESMNLLPTPWIEPEDVSALFVLLASDAGRYITGQAIPVDAGFLQNM